MIGPGPSHRYYFYRPPADMRKSFDGLCALVKSGMKRDPMSGDVFVFVNRKRSHLKALVWERNGFALFYKRLEAGTFELPKEDQPSWAQVVMLLEGVSLKTVRYRRRYAVKRRIPGSSYVEKRNNIGV